MMWACMAGLPKCHCCLFSFSQIKAPLLSLRFLDSPSLVYAQEKLSFENGLRGFSSAPLHPAIMQCYRFIYYALLVVKFDQVDKYRVLLGLLEQLFLSMVSLVTCLHFSCLEKATFCIRLYAQKAWCLNLYRLKIMILFSILHLTQAVCLEIEVFRLSEKNVYRHC